MRDLAEVNNEQGWIKLPLQPTEPYMLVERSFSHEGRVLSENEIEGLRLVAKCQKVVAQYTGSEDALDAIPQAHGFQCTTPLVVESQPVTEGAPAIWLALVPIRA